MPPASGSADTTVRVWEMATGPRLRPPPSPPAVEMVTGRQHFHRSILLERAPSVVFFAVVFFCSLTKSSSVRVLGLEWSTHGGKLFSSEPSKLQVPPPPLHPPPQSATPEGSHVPPRRANDATTHAHGEGLRVWFSLGVSALHLPEPYKRTPPQHHSATNPPASISPPRGDHSAGHPPPLRDPHDCNLPHPPQGGRRHGTC